jgi:hypothetical protein
VSERKQEEIDAMFKATQASKLEIEEAPKIKKIATIFDNSIQSHNALTVSSELCKRFGAELDVITSDDFYPAFNALINSTRDKITELVHNAQNALESLDVESKYHSVFSGRITRTMDEFDVAVQDDAEKLSSRLVDQLAEIGADIVVVGVPMYKSADEAEVELLGSYVIKLLRSSIIHANFLLVSEQTSSMSNSIISFIEVNQQPRSLVALTKRALSMADSDTSLKIIGFVENKTVETMASLDDEIHDDGAIDVPFQRASDKLKDKMKQTLDSLSINSEISVGSIDKSVKMGSIAEILNMTLEEKKDDLIMVRSVAEFAENLDPIADQITRHVLTEGFPCLIVWD